MLRGWLGGRQHGDAASLNAIEESQFLEEAMHAAAHMMDDDMDRAEAELAEGNSPFHKLGQGLVSFLRATLGFEREFLLQAAERLGEAETSALGHQARAQRHPSTAETSIYSAGTEYSLCAAEVQIMGAVVGVLTESVTESIRGFYKLRKAYLTLDSIMQEEKRHLASLGIDQKCADSVLFVDSHVPIPSSRPESSKGKSVAGSTKAASVKSHHTASVKASPEDKEASGNSTPPGSSEATEKMDQLRLGDPETLTRLRRLSSSFAQGPSAEIFGDNVIDTFIHSGSNLCYGIIMLMVSMLPPTFSTLSKIAGFKGDRLAGLGLLWQASKFENVNGAFAGLMILAYYNGFIGFCDVLPLTGRGAYPEERCRKLLDGFRKRFPNSRLWILEEARMLSTERRLEEASVLLDGVSPSSMKQVAAFQCFERSLNAMYLHQYEVCSVGFQKMVTLNNWSHGLYYYAAGISHVERYRELKKSDPTGAADHAKKAGEMFAKVPEHIGKKKFMARQLPFDVYVSRKLQKWEARAKKWKVDLVDAVGVSPIEEMIYFWNGYKRMRPEHLEVSLEKLEAWASAENPEWEKEALDEKAIYAALKAAALRNLGRREEAVELLDKEVIVHPWTDFKGGLKDNWTCPVAHYEKGVNMWFDFLSTGSSNEVLLKESLKWLEKAASWESYDLDTRVGLRVSMSIETVKRELEKL
ncbi:hypothetical protein EJ06DRAFT_509035 [Trichodelitschia bisporula]|uniref:Inclusion body clearance protein IML2 n=1 Tax=Trichodelitschia bisporula TaxID=703511 RepID=A0A6G1HZR2_9PEZI|nr:hypothetical protein EJ06DRAFT_509035 [Trichodelitschia bisporula]